MVLQFCLFYLETANHYPSYGLIELLGGYATYRLINISKSFQFVNQFLQPCRIGTHQAIDDFSRFEKDKCRHGTHIVFGGGW